MKSKGASIFTLIGAMLSVLLICLITTGFTTTPKAPSSLSSSHTASVAVSREGGLQSDVADGTTYLSISDDTVIAVKKSKEAVVTTTKADRTNSTALTNVNGSETIKTNTTETIVKRLSNLFSASKDLSVTANTRAEKNVSNQTRFAEEKTTDTINSEYKIDVSISEQTVRIYKKEILVKEFVVSTGIDQSTPKGDFEIQNRGEWFFSEQYQQGAKWWVSFKDWGVYLFHSVAMDSNKQIIQEEADKLGSPASHGCIRLTVDDAKWIYDNIPQGTPVHIE